MKKFVLLLISLIPAQLFAQFDFDSFSTNDQILIENSINNCFFITKQGYQIQNKKSKETFGLGGKETFGISYTLGIKIQDGCIISDKAMRPWKYDEKFNQYKSDYIPISSNSEFSNLSNKPNYGKLILSDKERIIINDSMFYNIKTSSFDSVGFDIDSEFGEKNGWLVWFVSVNNQNFEESTKLDFIISSQTYNIKEQSTNISESIVVPKSKGQIIGGIFIVPHYGLGCVTFKLCGILAEKNKIWTLLTPFIGYQKSISDKNKQSANSSGEKIIENEELTPLNKDKKTKPKKK